MVTMVNHGHHGFNQVTDHGHSYAAWLTVKYYDDNG